MEKKINLLHLTWRIYPYAGTERKVIQLINNLDKNRFNVFLVGLSEYDKAADNFIDNDIKLICLEKKEGIDFRAVLRLAKILRENKIHIVHSHNWATLFHAVIAAKLAGASAVHGEHGIETKEVNDSLKQKLLKRILFSLCTQLIAVSLYIKKFLMNSYNINEEKIALIYNGVEEAKPLGYNIKNKLNLSHYSHIIGTVGRMKPVKDFVTLIEAFTRVKKKYPKSALIIVGPGNEDNNTYYLDLKKKVDALNISDVFFLGAIDNVHEVLSTFDVYVNSSVYEGISNTILEAMAQKIPVVASNVGGNPELVKNNQTGLLFKSQDQNGCADCILKLIDDINFAENLIENAHHNISINHSMDSMYQKNIDIYNKVCSI